MVDWDKITFFNRYPKLQQELLKNVGDSVVVVFVSEEKDIPAEMLKGREIKTATGTKVKPRDSVVWIVRNIADNKEYELWLSATNYTNLRELAELRKQNGNKFTGLKVKITRIAKGDPEQANLKFEKA
ncbi:MAG: hypothetical protein QW734_03675 [Candidatus Bathyarchaeia archaeon]